MKKKLVQFGAGNIGRSFVGQVFARAGYEVVFVDIDETVISELNRRGEYTVVVKSDDAADERLTITGVRGVEANDIDAVVAELTDAAYAATAVGARALPLVAPTLAKATVARRGRPLDVIIAENVRGAAGILGGAYDESLAGLGTGLGGGLGTGPSVPARPGFVETSIGKMVPIMSDSDRAEDALQVFAEPYNTLIVDRRAFTTPLPSVPGLQAVEDIGAYVDRKLFIHNLGHAACSYLGFRADPSIRYVWQAVGLPEVRSATQRAMEDAACALVREYPDAFSKEDLVDHIEDLLRRFGNSALGDTIFRVGRDLKRKLSRDDRLVGAMRLCVRHGCPVEAIADAAAAGFAFRATDERGALFGPDAELAAELAAELDREETVEVVERVCGLDPTDPVDKAVEDAVLARLEG